MDLFWETLALAVEYVFLGNFLGKWLPLVRGFALPGAVLGGLLAYQDLNCWTLSVPWRVPNKAGSYTVPCGSFLVCLSMLSLPV